MPTQAGHQLTTTAHLEFQAILLELTLSESFFHCVGTWGFSAMTHIPKHTDKPRRETDLPGRGEQADADFPHLCTALALACYTKSEKLQIEAGEMVHG